MNILYVHGFGSQFDPEHEKVKQLESIGTVFGVSVDYTRADAALTMVRNSIIDNQIDVVIGTSMGGYTAAKIGTELGIPFVAINPATNPAESLKQYIGNNVDHTGREYFLTETDVARYDPIPTNGCGLILLDKQDEVISATATERLLDKFYNVVTFEGGCHRFSHMADSLELIRHHVENASIVLK